MGVFNPLAVILKEHKLTEPNYIDQKRNLDIMLTAEEYKYVLTQECREKPVDGCTDEVAIKAYKKWITADEMA